MIPRTVVDNDYITLWYHPDKKIVHHKIKPLSLPYTQRYTDLFSIALNAGTDLLRDNSAAKWLSDDRDSLPLPPEDVEWGQKVWAPKAVIAGWKYWAIVAPENLVSQLSSSNIVAKFSECGLTIKYFWSVEDAFKWLEHFP